MKKLTQAYVRRYVWAHNGLAGASRMAFQTMRSIVAAPTTTPAAKYKAEIIAAHLQDLLKELETRIDP